MFDSHILQVNKYPWMVAMLQPQFMTSPDDIRFGAFCGGSLVASKYVVTAAHCMFDAANMPLMESEVQVRLNF